MKTGKLTKISILAALMCIIAPWTVPSAVPFTLATFAVYLIAGISEPKEAVISVSLYILLGAFGLPVFSGFSGGIGTLIGLTGGFIIGYIPTVMIISSFKNRIGFVPSAIIATLVLYIIGTLWHAFVSDSTVLSSLGVCILPFIATDAIKIMASAFISSKLLKILKGVENRQ